MFKGDHRALDDLLALVTRREAELWRARTVLEQLDETKQEHSMTVEQWANVTMVNDGHDIFVEVNGVKIAKRGRPGTAQAGAWISLEPGWTVSDSGTHSLEIAHDGVPLQ